MGANQDLTGFDPIAELAATSVSLHLPALFSDLLPPFLEFFNAVLTHYQIHAMHLDSRSVVVLSSFAFLCKAFLGVPPWCHCSDTSSPSG
ncbi:erythrocyte binding protein-like [Hordeum vulgare]|nr:erythrocyte binding protein-like [Hordeum vulgare]